MNVGALVDAAADNGARIWMEVDLQVVECPRYIKLMRDAGPLRINSLHQPILSLLRIHFLVKMVH